MLQRIALSGREWGDKGWYAWCPFHEDTLPTMAVNEELKLFYCFECGRKGTLISFTLDPEDYGFALAELGETV